MIYRYLLVSIGCLTCVGDAVKSKYYHKERWVAYGLDARLLRSCRRLYEEALPILYRENHFVFTNLLGMGIFQKGGLVTARSKSLSCRAIPLLLLPPSSLSQ